MTTTPSTAVSLPDHDGLSIIELFPQDEDRSLQTMRLPAQITVGAGLFECAHLGPDREQHHRRGRLTTGGAEPPRTRRRWAKVSSWPGTARRLRGRRS